MDKALFFAINSLALRWPAVDALGVFAASGLIWVVGALVVAFWLLSIRARLVAAVSAFVSAAAALVISTVIGEIYFRPRPFAVLDGVHRLISKSSADKSFPSDHATASFALAFSVFLVNRRWGTVLLALAVVVSVARVFVGVHYVTDVLAGAIVGIGTAWIIHYAIHRVLRSRHSWKKQE